MRIRRQLPVALAMCLAGSLSASAQTASKPPEAAQAVADVYTGTTANMTSGAGSVLSFRVLRWSSDADREKVLSAIDSSAKQEAAAKPGAAKPDPNELGKALMGLPTVGYIWTSGPLGYALKYAYRATDADGGERVVVMTDRPLGSMEHPEWKVAGPVEPGKPFTVVELHLTKQGKGSGKMSLAAFVTMDQQTKTVSLTGYDAAPTLLTDVQRQAKPSGASQSR